MLRCLGSVLGILLFVSPLSALENLWQGGNGGDWNLPANWSLGVVPDFNHDAVIDGGLVSLPAETTLAKLVIRSGAVTWASGHLHCHVQVEAGGRLDLGGADEKSFHGTITCAGLVRTLGSGPIYGAGLSSALQIVAGGVFDFQSDCLLAVSPNELQSVLVISNAGIFRKSAVTAPGGTSLILGAFPSLTNTGSVQVEAGTLELANGLTNSGTVEVATGATCRLGGPIQCLPGGQFNGAGTVLLGANAVPGGVFFTGTYAGSARLVWPGGYIFGEWSLAPGATLEVGGAGEHVLSGKLQVSGSIVWTGAGPVCGTGSQSAESRLDILAGGLLDLRSDALLGPSPTLQPSSIAFSNAGTVRKSLSGQPLGSSRLAPDLGPLINTGLIEILQGQLEFSNGLTHSGTVQIAQGSTCRVSGSVVFESSGTFAGPGTVVPETVTFPGAGVSLQGVYRGSAELHWTGNPLYGSWTIGTGATFVVAGSTMHGLSGQLSNAGTIRWTGLGPVHGLASDPVAAVHNLATGLIDLQSDAVLGPAPNQFPTGLAISNAGIIRKSATSFPGGRSVLQVNNMVSPELGLENQGVIEILAGGIDFPTGLRNAGTVQIASGAACLLGGGVDLSTGFFHGAGLVVPGSPTFPGGGASFQGTYRGSALIKWERYQILSNWTLGEGSTLEVAGPEEHLLAGTLSNAGTIRWTGAGPVYGSAFGFSPPALENLPGGLIDLQSDAVLRALPNAFPTALAMSNAGTVRKSAGNGSSVLHIERIGSPSTGLTNTGLVEVLAGTIDFPSGLSNSGTVHVLSGTRCRLGGFVEFAGGQWNGAGRILTGSALVPGSGVSLEGTYSGSAMLTWEGEAIYGAWTLGTGAVLEVASSSPHYLAGWLRNAGTIRWTGLGPVFGFDSIPYPARLENLATGLIDLQTDSQLRASPFHFPSALAFSNAGTVRKSAGAPGGASLLQIDPAGFPAQGLINSGLVEIVSGGVDFSAGLSNAGVVRVASGARCYLGGSVDFNTGRFDGPGRVTPGSNSSPGGGVGLIGTYRGSAVLGWERDAIYGQWTIDVGAILEIVGPTEHALAGHLRNAGTIRWTGSGPVYGIASFMNPQLENLATGLIELLSSATLSASPFQFPSALALTNEGVIRKTGDTGSSVLQPVGEFLARGSIEVLSGNLRIPNGLRLEGSLRLQTAALETSLLNVVGGTLTGTGSVQGDVSNAGTVAPGNGASPGVLSIQGSYQDVSGSIAVRIGHASQVNDRVDIGGSASLGGILRVLLFDQATAATSFDALRFTAAQGSTGLMKLVPPALLPGQTLTQMSSAGALTVRVQSSLAAWRDTVFGPEAGNPAIAGSQADPNHNGLPNLFEYAFGLDPLSPAFGPVFARLPRLSLETSPGDGQLHLTISFQRRIGSDGQDLSYVVESTTGLFGTWDGSGAGLESAGPPVPDADGITERVSVRVVAPISSSPIRFLRLRVSEL